MRKLIYLISILLAVASCKSNSGNRSLNEFIEDPDNKISQKIKVGETDVTAKWLPSEYRTLLQNDVNNLNGNSVDTNYCFFNMKFENLNGDKLSKEKLLYVNFDIQNDFKLFTGTDSILPLICQKIENGKPGSYEYLLAFDFKSENPDSKDFELIYSDKIFSIGTLTFLYRQKDIQKTTKFKSTVAL